MTIIYILFLWALNLLGQKPEDKTGVFVVGVCVLFIDFLIIVLVMKHFLLS